MIRTAQATLLLLLIALAMAGCGGNDRVEYERDLARVGGVVDDALQALPQDDTQTTGPAEVAALAVELREAADQLSDLDPPEDARSAQQRLERGLRGVADAFDTLAEDLRGAERDEAKAEVFVEFATDQQVDAAFDDIIGAQEAYAARGYRVFGSAPEAATD